MLKTSLLAGFSIALVLAANDSRLSEAAMEGDRDSVRTLIQQKADIDGAQGDGTTALHWAAFKDDMEMVKMLVAAGANVRVTTREGAITPLFVACTNGDAAMIEVLLKAGADAKSVKSNGTTALMTVSASGSVDAVKVLLDHGADVNAKETAHGQTALMFAAALNRADVVKLLLARKADANITTSVRKLERVRFDQDGNVVEDRGGRGGAQARRGSRPEDVAASKEAADKADEAADAQTAAEALKKSSDEERADLEALAHGMAFKSVQFKIAKVVAKAGDVAFRPPRKVGADFQGGMTALLYAAREGHMETVRALVEGGADVNVVSAGDKFSPTVEAITNGHLDLAKYLLDHGADPNLANISGLTALYATVDVQWAPHAWFPQPSTDQEKTGYLDLMKQLIAKGANVNAPIGEKLWFRSFTNDYTWVDPAGATPFWRAAQSSDTAAMKLLVEHGADPKLATKSGDTPLHAATGIGWAANWSVNAPVPLIDAVKYCVELGNDVNAADNRGYTALHGAAYLGDNDMVNYLVSKGAKIDVKSKTGDSAADMANGPTRFGQPHAETVALLEKLGSPNSHNCRSDQCVVAAHANVYDRPLSPAEQADKDALEKVAVSFGFKGIEYRADGAGGRGATGSQN
jgi:ankyrin repeat protein